MTHNPDCLRDAFPHIRRMRDPRFPHEIATILPGEYFVSRAPMIVYTVLGSCVSVCIRDPLAGVGGMNHFMLPAPKGDGRSDSWGESARYGSFAMEMLINEILKRGGRKSRLEVKVFGGGRIYDGGVDIGVNNAVWALEYVAIEGYTLARADVGDIYPRKLYYFTDSGKVLMKRIEREERCRADTIQQPAASDVTLF
jgi:chemotaxis protein CheD